MKQFYAITLLFLSFSLAAQQKLTPELLWKMNRIGAPVLSPNGEMVVYTQTSYDLEENKGHTDLMMVPVKGGKPVNLTASWEFSVYDPEWRPDGKRIAFLTAMNDEMQISEIDPFNEGSMPDPVTNHGGGITGFHYANDMSKIVFSAEVKLDNTVADMYPDMQKSTGRIMDNLMYRHWNEWSDYSYSHIFVQEYSDGHAHGNAIDIMAGEKYDAPLKPFGGSEEFCFSPDGKKVAYTSKKLSGKEYAESTNSEIYEYNLESGEIKVLSAGLNGYDKSPVYSPDGSKIAWSCMKTPGYESDKNTIIVLDFATNIRTDILATIDQNADNLVWDSKGETLYFISGVKARFHIHSIDVASKSLKVHSTGDYNYGSFAVAKKQFVVSRTDMSHPAELYLVDQKKGDVMPLTTANADIMSKLLFSKVEEKMIKTSTGEMMQCWVILPPNFDPTKKYPTLLYCQGGPQSAISQYYSFRWNFELMAANGYVIVAPNRHGVPTFGQAWNHQISGDWGGQAMNDYLSAIDYASTLPYVDKNRLGAVGASYGGYSVYWLAGNHDKRFKCFIAHCGLFNLDSWYATTEELFFANYDLKGAPWDSKLTDSYQKFNPANFVNNWDAPIMVIHNEKDFRVPIGEGIQAFNTAQIKGIPSRFLYFPNEGHWVLGPQNGVVWHREFFRWLDTYLK